MRGQRVDVKRLLSVVRVLALIGVLVVALVLAGMWFEHRITTELPKPTGPFAIGRTTLHWVIAGQVDDFAPLPGSPRELVVWVWYPSAPGPGTPAEYLPGPWRAALARRGGHLTSDFLNRDLSRVHVHSRENVDLAPDQSKYPVVVLRGGLDEQVTSYTVLAEDLASHGYVVVGADAPYRTAVVVFPDGRTVFLPSKYNVDLMPQSEKMPFFTRLMKMWSVDVGFTVDKLAELNANSSSRFAGRLDLEHLGVFGHSLGGATAAHFCHEDPRCKAGINLDGRPYGPVIEDGLPQPFIFVIKDHRQFSNPSSGLRDIQSMYARLPADSRLKISLAGSNHFSFSDQVLLKSQVLLGIKRRTGAIGALEGRRGLAITADYVHCFFDVYLKGQPRTTLDTLASRYPEVLVE